MMDRNSQSRGLSRRQLLQNGAVASAASLLSPALNAARNTMRTDDSLAWLPARKLRQMMLGKEISPLEVTRYFLQRIEILDPIINAYITVDHDGALAQAKAMEKSLMGGEPPGRMFGLPISVKDLVMTKGLRTTYGSKVYENNIPEWDEIQLERLRAAGAIIIGKTNTPEFGRYPRTRSLVGGETLNPWDLKRISGASSGGSAAAVAAGISALAIASDGGGSTRIPASFNGVFGLQPSAGRIPMRSPKKVVMSSTGPATLHVEDAALIMSVIGGPDPRDPSAIEHSNPDFQGLLGGGVNGAKIAWTPDFGRIPIIDSRVVDATAHAVRRFNDAGAIVEMPSIKQPDNSWEIFWALNAYATGDSLSQMTAEQFDLLSPPLKSLFELIKSFPKMSADMEMAALEQRAGLQRWVDGVFEKYDFICSPVTSMIAPHIPEGWAQPYEHPLYAEQISTPFTHSANILGLPAASVPCGFIDGMPIGLQIIAPRFADLKVLQAAQVFAELQPWMDTHPTLP